jgi:hypothetical protein
LVTLVTLTGAPAVAQAKVTQSPGVLPPEAHAFGTTYQQLSVEWWQWALSIPASVNPLVDETGANCAVGQSGRVWFLAGSFGGEINRTCTIPAGRAVFFPVLNIVSLNIPAVETAAQLQYDIRGWRGGAKQLYASIDGVPVQDLSAYSVASPAEGFIVTWPADNFFELTAGTRTLAASDGVYLLLAPLSTGTHQLRFGGVEQSAPGTCNGCDGTLDVIYTIVVKG